jgi:Tfp pilus assembly protein PilO
MNAKNIFGAVCVAIALFFLWPGVFGSWAQMQALKAALAERQQTEKDRAAILERFANEYAKLKQINTTDAGLKFAAMVPVGKGTAEMVSAVQDIATTSGLQLLSADIAVGTNTTAATANLPYQKMTLKLSVSGPYAAFRTFLSSLEAYVRILNVGKISISSGVGASEGALIYEVTADSYFIK